MLTSGSVLLQIVIRTAIIYILILIGVRLSGKREVGQMTPFDLVLLLLLSNSVQNAMTGPDNSLIGGIVAAATLFLLNRLVAEYSGVNRRFRKVIQGSPTMIIHNGDVLLDHMAKEHLSMDELEHALRRRRYIQPHRRFHWRAGSGWLYQLLEVRRYPGISTGSQADEISQTQTVKHLHHYSIATSINGRVTRSPHQKKVSTSCFKFPTSYFLHRYDLRFLCVSASYRVCLLRA